MASLGDVVRGFSGLKGKLLLFAGILAVAGLGLNSVEKYSPEEKTSGVSPNSPSLKTDWTNHKEALSEYSKSHSWGDGAIHIGLSFGIAMIFAGLLKAFLKSMITFALIVGAVCWFLNDKGFIEPFWLDFDLSADSVREWVFAQTETAKGFLAGVLPSTGAAIAGFLFGLRR